MFFTLHLVACVRPASDTDSMPATDAVVMDPSDTADTGTLMPPITPSATGHTGVSGETGDTGPALPEGLVGVPPITPIGPNLKFQVWGPDGYHRYWWDLYDGQPTLLYFVTFQNQGDSSVDAVMYDLVDLIGGFDLLDVKIVVLTGGASVEVDSWVRHYNPPFEIWGDTEEVLHQHYGLLGSTGAALIDGDGNLLLNYNTAYPASWTTSYGVGWALDDCFLLFGD